MAQLWNLFSGPDAKVAEGREQIPGMFPTSEQEKPLAQSLGGQDSMAQGIPGTGVETQ